MTTTCATWCGTVCLAGDMKRRPGDHWWRSKDPDPCYCTPGCRDAGKPLHPVSKPPGEPPHEVPPPTPRAICTHPGFDESGRCHTCGDVVALAVPCGFAKTMSAMSAPGSALPLPGPSELQTGDECPMCKRPVWAGKCGRSPMEGECDEPGGTECTLRRNLAEARTALAEERDIARRYARQLEDRACDIADLRARLAVTVGALERANGLLRRYLYDGCACIDLSEGDCAICAETLAALAPTGAPPCAACGIVGSHDEELAGHPAHTCGAPVPIAKEPTT